MNSAGHMVDSNVEIRIIESWDCMVFASLTDATPPLICQYCILKNVFF